MIQNVPYYFTTEYMNIWLNDQIWYSPAMCAPSYIELDGCPYYSRVADGFCTRKTP